jgi:hypothetical protein
MNVSIDHNRKPLMSTWQFKFFIGSILILLGVLMTVFNVRPFRLMVTLFGQAGQHLFPPISAAGITVKNAISEFSAHPYEPLGWVTYLSAFMTLCLTFVAGPTVYVMLRRRMIARRNAQQPVSRTLRTMAVITASWCILFSSAITAAYIAADSVFPIVKSDNALAEYRDQVTEQLALISFKAREFFALPESDGGGGDSFTRGNTPVTLRTLGFKERSELGRFILTAGESDTTMRLFFFGNRVAPGKPWESQETDHVIEYEAVISPSRHTIIMK